ncbi:hypothetical protein NE237_005130 [Protea cynaroides]|uniref:Uncharacterized protein n=1 Tax=Protea cynaroides TaxID=273540 RepID=A0A9Q0KKS1_9MAGN|nr:hypothetical protein NE237_005130 [Protea cynaroides]
MSGPQGTFVRFGSSGDGYPYREMKLYGAQREIEAISLNLGLLPATFTENTRSLAISKVSSVIGCDILELGRMAARVVDFLDLKLPEFDVLAHFERAIHKCPSFTGISNGTKETYLSRIGFYWSAW